MLINSVEPVDFTWVSRDTRGMHDKLRDGQCVTPNAHQQKMLDIGARIELRQVIFCKSSYVYDSVPCDTWANFSNSLLPALSN